MSASSASAPEPSAFPRADTVDDFRRNLAAVHGRMEAAARAAGREPGDIRLLPVSKTVPEDRLRLALEAGCTLLGENKLQEAKRKWQNLADTGASWSVIGHLQANKAKDVVALATEFQALDSRRIAEALDRRLEAADRTLDVFVQVNTSREESKFGLDPRDALRFLRELRQFPRLRVQGLMTLAVFTPDEARVRACFADLRALRDRARDDDPALVGPGDLSMGMSGDYEIAIDEGATVVRVGQAIFGARQTPNSEYWPTDAVG